MVSKSLSNQLADVLTKHGPGELLDAHLKTLGMEVRGGRAETAPTLDSVEVEYIKEKVKSFLQSGPSSVIEQAKSKMCGKTNFHIFKVFETMPFMAIVPTDMGFPVYIESQNTKLVSMKGALDVDCTNRLPSVQLKSTIKAAFSWTGFVGALSPFAQEPMQLGSGINNHMTINLPVEAVIRVEPETGSLKVEMKQIAEAARATNIDLVHYSVIPFTTMKPLFSKDMAPIILATSNTKIIETSGPKRVVDVVFGEKLGLSLKLKGMTESELPLDRKSVIDILANYNYNPVYAMLFLGSQTAIRPDGTPTLRYAILLVM